MTAAVLRAEFLRALPLLPWLLAAHAMALWIRVRPEDATLRWLGGIAEWAIWVLSGLMLVGSLWEGNPSRRDHFLATRPLSGSALFLGKFTGLLMLIALPMVLVELGALVAAEQPARVILLGMLQTATLVVVVVFAAFAFVWLWATRVTAAAGLLLALVATGLLIFAEAEVQPRTAQAAVGYLLAPVRQLWIWGASASTAFALLLVFGKRRPWLRVPLFAGACSLAVLAVLRFPIALPAVDARERAALVHLDMNLYPTNRRVEDSLEIKPPSLEPGPEFERTWSFSKLVVNGRRMQPWQGWRDLHVNTSLQSLPIQCELRRHFGDRLQLPSAWQATPYQASALLPGEHDPARSFDFDLSVLETLTRWQLVADLPLQAGATAEHQGTRWAIEGVIPVQNAEGRDGRVVRMREVVPLLWMGNPSGEPAARIDLYILVDTVSGRALQVGSPFDYGQLTAGAFRWSVRDSRTRLDLSVREHFDDEPPIDWSHEQRLVILRPVVVRRISYDWRSPRPVPSSVIPEERRWTDREGIDPWNGTAPGWLAEHPAPAADSDWKAIAAWLDELHPRIGRRNLTDKDRDALTAAVAPLAKEHLEEFQDYRRLLDPHSHEGKRIFQEAMIRHLTAEVLAKSESLAADAALINLLAAKGRLADVAPHAANLARMGQAWRVQSALYGDPRAVGLSEAEWLDFYRLYASPVAFWHLCDTVLPRAVLEAETDRMLAGFEAGGIDQFDARLDLAMARGHPQAPVWLHRWISSQRARDRAGRIWVNVEWKRFVEVPSALKSEVEIMNWYLAQDPARFAFDLATGKYQLR